MPQGYYPYELLQKIGEDITREIAEAAKRDDDKLVSILLNQKNELNRMLAAELIRERSESLAKQTT